MNESINIFFAGDFCSTTPERIKISEKLLNVINSCDLKFLNFEGPLRTETFEGPNKTILKQSDAAPKWCEEHNFNIISVANNHLLDFGVEGLLKTINAFKRADIIGAGTWDEAYKVHYVECKGKNLGFFAASSADLASLQDYWTEKDHLGAAWINHNSVNRLIQTAKENCDYLFVISHAGVEHMQIPLPEWRDRYKELIDFGADAVVAAHPHIVQGWEIHNGHPIFYSLGNFFFDYFFSTGKPHKWDNGLCVKLSINYDGCISFETIPTIKDGQNLDVDTSEDVRNENERLCAVLSSPNYIEEVNRNCLSLYDRYKGWLLEGLAAHEMNRRGVKSTIKSILVSIKKKSPNYKIALHQLREESTRYLMKRALELKINK